MKIVGINDGIDVVQILTLTAAAQVIGFIFWIYNHQYEYAMGVSSEYTKSVMVQGMLLAVPYLLKGNVTITNSKHHRHYH